MGFVFKKDQPSSEFAPGVTRRIVNSDATESKMLYVSEITIAPGKAAPLVTHPDDEEGVLVVEGKLTLVLERQIYRLQCRRLYLYQARTGTRLY